MKEIIKGAAVLTVITLVAGVLLGFVYDITKEPIAQQEALEKQEACEAVLAEADSFDTEYVMTALGIYDGAEITEVIPALSADDEVIGYALNVTSSEGYGGDISFIMGIEADGTVTGISFTSISETAGLGMRATEKAFYEQFADKQVTAFTYTKNGAAADDEIDALSGATVTTSAVTNAVNAGISYFYDYLYEEATE